MFIYRLSKSKRSLVWCAACNKLSAHFTNSNNRKDTSSKKKTKTGCFSPLKCVKCHSSKSITHVKTIFEDFRKEKSSIKSSKFGFTKIDKLLDYQLEKCFDCDFWRQDIQGCDNLKCRCLVEKPALNKK